MTAVGSVLRYVIVLMITAGAGVCLAQAYPLKPVRYVVTGSPGSSTDVLGRFMADGLTQQFGRQFVVENRTGAGSNIGPEFVSKSPADGYTLLQMTISHAVNATLYRSLGYDIIRDFAPVTQLVTDPAVLSVHPSLPAANVAALSRLAKGRPDALAYASGGTGTFTFLAAELFNSQAGVKMLHVPYKGGGPALIAVIAGEVSVYFAPLGVALPYLQSRRLRPLGVTTLQRLPLLPEVPTVSEAGLKGYEAGNWFALLAPARTPRDIVASLHAASLAVLRNPAAGKRLNEMAYVPVGSAPDELAAHIRHEVERLGKVVRALNLSTD